MYVIFAHLIFKGKWGPTIQHLAFRLEYDDTEKQPLTFISIVADGTAICGDVSSPGDKNYISFSGQILVNSFVKKIFKFCILIRFRSYIDTI